LTLSRNQLRVLGGVFLVFGLLEIVGSYFIAASITTYQATAAQQAVERANQCKDRLTTLGYTAKVDGNKISAEVNGLNDAAYKLGQATMGVLSCQGWKLARFCMGEGCGPTGGVQFDLEPSKSNN
jgi:hypothetical protein